MQKALHQVALERVNRFQLLLENLLLDVLRVPHLIQERVERGAEEMRKQIGYRHFVAAESQSYIWQQTHLAGGGGGSRIA